MDVFIRVKNLCVDKAWALREGDEIRQHVMKFIGEAKQDEVLVYLEHEIDILRPE